MKKEKPRPTLPTPTVIGGEDSTFGPVRFLHYNGKLQGDPPIAFSFRLPQGEGLGPWNTLSTRLAEAFLSYLQKEAHRNPRTAAETERHHKPRTATGTETHHNPRTTAETETHHNPRTTAETERHHNPRTVFFGGLSATVTAEGLLLSAAFCPFEERRFHPVARLTPTPNGLLSFHFLKKRG